MKPFRIPWYAWNIINPIREWLHTTNKWISLLVSILSVAYPVYVVCTIPGITVMAVVYGLLFIAVALLIITELIVLLSNTIPMGWLEKYMEFDRKFKSYKGGLI